MKVAVIGGGIGGMSLALSLHAVGIADVEIYESTPAIRELGVGINVLPHAVRELAELGLLDVLSSVGVATADFTYFSRLGQRIGRSRSESRQVTGGPNSPSIVASCWASSIAR